MKTFVTAVSIAVLAFVLLEIAQSDARRGEKCPEGKRPSLNTTEVKCDSRPGLIKALKCAKNCTDCYERELLQRVPGCLNNNGTVCTCLAKPTNSSITTTTTQPSVTETAAG
ncbi:hypothetical protein Ocin01_13071 [Orchesella cincta]|uniref:Uncharacterized protein n=1 Tax=Orchesella cincta TaxID=48709 RepID=A0A1D2ML44_ORCCI|nr:hypothetical protein Ocin01_13071 [Orchesella cincta]